MAKWLAMAASVALAMIPSAAAHAADSLSAAELDQLPIEDLAKIDVSSVTKSPEGLNDAPAAIYVITHDDIVRSGATTLPEILRLAPNLQVFQSSPSQYVITARGFNGDAADQSYSNKLLVLIDGRSVYSPLYSGVYWDMQDVLPQDIDRIEVISGPGATLWGANAVNGVINIITRKSSDTQGALVDVESGDLQSVVGLRYGGAIGGDLTYRAYFRDVIDYQTETAAGAPAHDGWSKPQGGFRLDWTPSLADTVTFQGDGYTGTEEVVGAPNEDIAGGDLLARWNHGFRNGSELQVQAYYDLTQREAEGSDGGGFVLDTYDVDLQHSFGLGSRNQIVWGGGLRVDHYDITGTPALSFDPASRTLDLANVFLQDSVSITKTLDLILGAKLEDDPYSGPTPLPSARLSWKPSETVLLWAAVSRAIRSPTPFDEDVRETVNPGTASAILFLEGNSAFQPEKLTAYEVGARIQPISRASFSISGFYNVYDGLRSLELDFASPTLLPFTWGNKILGDTYGVEAWSDYQIASWWRLSPGVNVLFERMGFQPGASGLLAVLLAAPQLGLTQLGDDPKYEASLKSSMNLGPRVTLDADLRYVDTLPDPHLPSYVELNGRLGWKLSEHVSLSLSGLNLLHARHMELPAPALPVARSFLAGLQWGF